MTWTNYLAPDGNVLDVAAYCQIRSSPPLEFADDVTAAALAVEGRYGPMLTTTETVIVERYVDAIDTDYRVTAITGFVGDDGTTYAASDLRAVSPQVVTHADGYQFPPGTLTYTTGYASASAVPMPLVIMGMQVARQLWRARSTQARAEGEPGWSWLWPKQAEALCAPYELAPRGFA